MSDNEPWTGFIGPDGKCACGEDSSIYYHVSACENFLYCSACNRARRLVVRKAVYPMEPVPPGFHEEIAAELAEQNADHDAEDKTT